MEIPVKFYKDNIVLYGIIHQPNINLNNTAVIMITGGPQTRYGGHRLYLQLARFLCNKGMTVLRFDYEGMGDSEGTLVRYIGAGPSIKAAIALMMGKMNAVPKIILWSICDGTVAVAKYARENKQLISGIILCNPLNLYENNTIAQAHLRYYYMRRLVTKDFWQRLYHCKINIVEEIKNVKKILLTIMDNINKKNRKKNIERRAIEHLDVIDNIINFRKNVHLIFSTEDIVAMEFRNIIKRNRKINKMINDRKCFLYIIKDSDHTFTSRNLKNILFKTTLCAIKKIY